RSAAVRLGRSILLEGDAAALVEPVKLDVGVEDERTVVVLWVQAVGALRVGRDPVGALRVLRIWRTVFGEVLHLPGLASTRVHGRLPRRLELSGDGGVADNGTCLRCVAIQVEAGTRIELRVLLSTREDVVGFVLARGDRDARARDGQPNPQEED